MKQTVFLCLLFIYSLFVVGQEGFMFEKGVEKVSIPFKFINNLIFIPIKVNGVELNFLMDSGVEETILFSMEEKKEVSFSNVEKITLRGLGSEESIEGLKSTNNTLEIKGLKSSNHLLYIVLDQSFNLSSHIGIPVNGIIGYGFLKTNLVEINYEKKRITVRTFTSYVFPLSRNDGTISNFNTLVILNSNEIPVKLLIDIGNSDAIWLFENESKGIKIPKKNFEDYLGKGFSGDVEGKRAQISMFKLSKFEFRNPIVAFPDSTSIKNVRMVKERSGSVGSEILKRFSIVFDYPNQKMFVRKNNNFNAPFSYNKSGVEIQHDGMQWVQETVRLETVPIRIGDAVDARNSIMNNDFKYKFQLKPIYIIANVRKNSPAAISGLQKGDIIVKINDKPGYQFTLEKINSLLKSEDENWITFEIERNSQILKFKFQLLNVL